VDKDKSITDEMIDAGVAELDGGGYVPKDYYGFPCNSDFITRDIVANVFLAMLAKSEAADGNYLLRAEESKT